MDTANEAIAVETAPYPFSISGTAIKGEKIILNNPSPIWLTNYSFAMMNAVQTFDINVRAMLAVKISITILALPTSFAVRECSKKLLILTARDMPDIVTKKDNMKKTLKNVPFSIAIFSLSFSFLYLK